MSLLPNYSSKDGIAFVSQIFIGSKAALGTKRKSRQYYNFIIQNKMQYYTVFVDHEII
jgi:hypothetical protein